MKQNTLKTRESNYDILRIICTVAVIVIHTSATYKEVLFTGDRYGNFHTGSMLAIVLYNTLSRFAVPCFMMLSGAFLLSDNRNADFKYFYRKSFKTVIIQMIIFSFVFLGYSEFLSISKGNGNLLNPVKNLLTGQPCYHMWYLYMLAGVYALLPLILRLKNSVSEKTFQKISWIYLIIATLSGWTSTFKLEWSISKVVCYLGFLLVGYQLRKNIVKKNNLQGIILIIVGFLSQLVISYIQYQHASAGIAESEEKYSLIGNFNPIIVLASVLIFAGFSKLNIKNCRLGNLPKLTFYIYIFHTIVWDAVRLVSYKAFGCLPKAEICIPLSTVVIFIASYALSFVYDKVWRAVDRKFLITDKVCDLLKLS